MQAETTADCLNIIDDALIEGVNTIGILESIHKNLVEKEEVNSSKIELLYQKCLVKQIL